jgi:outer membrane lipoprotein-sorting protein
MYRLFRPAALVLTLVVLPLSGCLIRSERQVTRISTATLQDATLDQLEGIINNEASRLQTFVATVDIDFSAGGAKKGKVTDYTQVSGYILVRKPENMRMVVKAPVVRTNLVDMVSNGQNFKLSLPSKNQFWVGSNQVAKPSTQPLMNLRPQHILDALLLKAVDPEKEIAVLEQSSEIVKDTKTHKSAEEANYVVLVIEKDAQGSYLSRKIVFSRVDLLPHEQYVYDRHAQLVTFARYDNFSDHGGLMFPEIIDIQRPIEEYAFRLTVEKLRLNEPLQDDQFVLNQPPGSKLVNLDEQNTSAQIRPESKEAIKDPE